MTRSDLLERRAHLLAIYQNPNPEHELQHVEVTAELDWIAAQLLEMPPEPREDPSPGPKKRAGGQRKSMRDGRAMAAGDVN